MISAYKRYQISQRARVYLRDRARPFSRRFVTTGEPVSHSLPMPNIVPDSVTVTIGGTVLDPTTGFRIDYDNGELWLTDEYPAEVEFYVEGSFWEWFSDRDLSDYTDIVVDNYSHADADLDTLTNDGAVINCMAAAVLVEGLWALLTEVARDIDVRTPEGDIPATQRYRQLMSLLEFWQSELNRMEQALNIGLFRLEMYNLRRVSMRNGRLVPLYVEQEYDDTDPPVRVKPKIDPGGPIVVVGDTDAELAAGSEYLITVVRGLPFILNLVYKDEGVPVDMSAPGWTSRLVVKTDRGVTTATVVEFTAPSQITLGAQGAAVLDLSDSETLLAPGGYVYDWAVYDPSGAPAQILSGVFFVEATTL